MATISIVSRLPYSLILDHEAKTVTIQGVNKSQIIGATEMTTEVDAEFWAVWKESHADFAPLKNMAIFAVEDKRSMGSMIKDAIQLPTGLERLKPDSMGVNPA